MAGHRASAGTHPLIVTTTVIRTNAAALQAEPRLPEPSHGQDRQHKAGNSGPESRRMSPVSHSLHGHVAGLPGKDSLRTGWLQPISNGHDMEVRKTPCMPVTLQARKLDLGDQRSRGGFVKHSWAPLTEPDQEQSLRSCTYIRGRES